MSETEDRAADALREKVAEAVLAARWPDGLIVTAVSGKTAPMIADAVLAALDLPALLAAERERVLREAADAWDDDSPEHLASLNRLAEEHYRPGGPSMPAIWLRVRASAESAPGEGASRG